MFGVEERGPHGRFGIRDVLSVLSIRRDRRIDTIDQEIFALHHQSQTPLDVLRSGRAN